MRNILIQRRRSTKRKLRSNTTACQLSSNQLWTLEKNKRHFGFSTTYILKERNSFHRPSFLQNIGLANACVTNGTADLQPFISWPCSQEKLLAMLGCSTVRMDDYQPKRRGSRCHYMRRRDVK